MTGPLNPVHPWNRVKAKSLTRDRVRLPHALLMCGPKGVGKNALAQWLAQCLLCSQSNGEGDACGQCHNCRLFSAGSHPDLHVVQPEAIYKASEDLLSQYAQRYAPVDKSKESKDSTVIRIDQIRSLIENALTRPQIGACKLLLLSPADSMNVNAANSLLKLLEEPPADSYLVLIADRPVRLPATIRSRCSRIDVSIPPRPLALAWLAGQGLAEPQAHLLLDLAGGAPMAAHALAQSDFLAQRASMLEDMEKLAGGQIDPLTCAARWKTLGAERCLLWMQGYLSDLVGAGLGGGIGHLYNPDSEPRLQALEKRLDLKQLFQFADVVGRNRALLGGPLDEQLMLEDTLIRWTQLAHNS